MEKQALGMVETKGLVGSIEAADAMVKAANIQLVGTEVIGGAMLTVAIKGEIGAVRTAVDAGAAAAKQAGKLHCANVIARPSADAAKVLTLDMSDQAE